MDDKRSTDAPPPADPGKAHDQPAVAPWLSWSIMLALGLAIWSVDGIFDARPRPDIIKAWGWRLLAIFAPTILGLMLRPLPGGAIVLLALCVLIGVDGLPPVPPDADPRLEKSWPYEQALAGYMNDSVWLVLAAYFMSRALINTGLARRIALTFVRLLGKNTLGLSYSLTATDTVLAGMIPSNAARVGGVILPITRSLAELYRSFPGVSAGLLGAFLMVNLYQTDVVNCAMHYTGQASNPMAADQAAALTDGRVKLTYAKWLLYASVPALVSLLIVPWLLIRIMRPEIRRTPEAPAMARRELTAMGPMSHGEWIMLVVFVGVCAGWIALPGKYTTLIALGGACLLFLSRVLTWDDAIKEKGAWDVFIWYGGLVQMGTLLNRAGITKAFAEFLAAAWGAWPAALLFVALLIVYFYAHYAFASITAHMLSMFPAFVTVLIIQDELGTPRMPEWLVVVAFAYFTNLCAGLTHYGTTPAPIVFGTGYVSHGQWWRVGFLMSLVNIVIWLGVGLPWWKLWGLW